MNFTSQICTSRSQPERLLTLGLKKETADMKYPCTTEYYGGILTEGMSSLPMIINTEDDEVTEYDLPSWSLHRLIEIANLPQYWECISGNWYEEVIATIQSEIHIGELNKEYLEE